MRTKILLAAAAALAVGVASSMAQTYSQNVVGYINTTIPANGFAMMGNTLINGSDANQTNNDVSTMLSGLVSTAHDGGTSSNTVLYYWNGTSYSTWYYYNSSDALANGNIGQAVAGWYDSLGNQLIASVPQGNAIFVKNVFSAPITATLTGNVQQGTNTTQVIHVGYNQISLQVPVATNLFAGGFGLPQSLNSTSSDSPAGHDILYYWNGSYSTWYYYNTSDALASGNVGQAVPDFYDSLGNELPTPPVNAGLFLYHVSGSPIPFTTIFKVQ